MSGFVVEFKFKIDAVVVSPVTGERGVVAMCAVDDGGNKMYFIKTTNGEKWWPERHLDLAE